MLDLDQVILMGAGFRQTLNENIAIPLCGLLHRRVNRVTVIFRLLIDQGCGGTQRPIKSGIWALVQQFWGDEWLLKARSNLELDK